jgi:glycosyltransferase involved in cell wall biosynthesis
MKVVLLFMSKQFAGGVEHRPQLLARAKAPGRTPNKIKTWSGAILAGLARRGHEATFVCLEPEAYVRSRLGCDPARYSIEPRFEAIWTSRYDIVRPHLEAAGAILMRDSYAKHAEVFAGFPFADRPLFIISASARFRAGFTPADANLTLLLNSPDECAELGRLGFRCAVFRKPAHGLFYEPPETPVRKIYDAAFVTWETATPRKRFDLVLDALAHLEANSDRRLSLVVVGDSSAHAERIEGDFRPPARVEVHRAGRANREELRDVFHRSRLTVVASSRDANPQVIAESLACDVPVACAADITGGAFQITPPTGELFAPTPEALAATLISMLDRLDTYQPRAHCITVDDAVDQIEAIIGSVGARS